MDDNDRGDNDRKKKPVLCCDQNEIATIVACLCELKNTIDCVLECTCDHSSGIKERIILCKLLDEIRQIEAKLDNPLFGLNEIKHEIIDINNIITNSTFGLREIKNEVRDIDSLLTNQFFGLNEIKNEVITINDLLNNTTFGIPEIKNEIRIIENRTARTNNLLTNQIFGLNEIKNEIRGIENTFANLPNSLTITIFNNINTTLNFINNTVNNSIFGLNEIKNEIRGIENQTILLTNNTFGLNEIKNEIRSIESAVNPPSSLTTGPVIAAASANNLFVKALNNTQANQTVRVRVFNLAKCPKCINEIFNSPLGPIPPGCACETANISLSSVDEYEVEVSDLVPGVYLWSSAFPGTDPRGSIAINTFRHADFVRQIFNIC